jgi:hypothetical protein
MEPVDLLSVSQEPVTGLYTEPDESSLHSIYLRFILISYSRLILVLLRGLSQIFRPTFVQVLCLIRLNLRKSNDR